MKIWDSVYIWGEGIWVVNVHESSFKIVGAPRVSQKKKQDQFSKVELEKVNN